MIKNWVGFYTLIRREVGRTKRVIGQAVVTPLVTAILYVFVFGYVVGNKIELIEGIKYISFVFPGLIGMTLMMTVFNATSFSTFFMKFQKTIEELLTLPISYIELVLSLIVGGVIRAFLIAVPLALLAISLDINTLVHPVIFILYVTITGLLFGVWGLIAGIWADNSFEKLGIVGTFLLMPLTFIGGTFYSLSMLPEKLQFLATLNPVFYAIDGIRYSFTGFHDASLYVGISVLAILTIISIFIAVGIFKSGWKLRS